MTKPLREGHANKNRIDNAATYTTMMMKEGFSNFSSKDG
jgi:hypothetical protein